MTYIEIEDLIPGEIYFHKTQYEYLIRFSHIGDNDDIIGDKCVLRVSIQSWSGSSYRNPSKYKLREATYEEKLWYNTCLKEDKFIPYEDIIKNNYEIY